MPWKIINDSSSTNLLANIGPTLQVLRFSLFEGWILVDDLLDEHWKQSVERENISTPIYTQCNNLHEVPIKDLLSRILLYLVWPQNSSKIKIQYAKIGSCFDNSYPLFPIQWNKLVAQWLSQLRVFGNWDQIPQRAETLCSHLASHGLTLAPFIFLHSLTLFSLLKHASGDLTLLLLQGRIGKIWDRRTCALNFSMERNLFVPCSWQSGTQILNWTSRNKQAQIYSSELIFSKHFGQTLCVVMVGHPSMPQNASKQD